MTTGGECPDARRKGDTVRQGVGSITKPSDAPSGNPSDIRWASEKTLTDDYRLAVRFVALDHLTSGRRFSTATVAREIESRSLPMFMTLLDRVLRDASDERRLIHLGNDCWAAIRGAW